MSDRRGFTLIELITVVVVLGVLVSIAIPKYQTFTKRAKAADIMTEMVAIRTAAFAFNESSGGWPASAARGTVPRGMGPYLPGSLSFKTTDRTFAWTSAGARIRAAAARVQLITMTTTDPVVCQGVAGLWGGGRNVDLVRTCGKKGGSVQVFVDR